MFSDCSKIYYPFYIITTEQQISKTYDIRWLLFYGITIEQKLRGIDVHSEGTQDTRVLLAGQLHHKIHSPNQEQQETLCFRD